VAVLPPGEGGGLLVRAPQEFCVDGKNEFHLHHRVELGGVQFIFEAPAGPSACEWQVNDLPEGTYEALIQVAPEGRILARAEGEVVRGVLAFISLQAPDMELQGYVTGGGRPRPDVVLRFESSGTGWLPHSPVTITNDGGYDVKVGSSQTDQLCAHLSARYAANRLTKCAPFAGGVQRFDVDFPPGIIRITVPAFAAQDGSEAATIELQFAGSAALALDQYRQQHSFSDSLLVAQGGRAGFRTRNGFRGDYIGVLSGDYVVSLIIGNNATPVMSVPVTVSDDKEIVELTLSTEAR
jgi:hypothetical protein